MNGDNNDLLKQVMIGLVGVGIALSAQTSVAAKADMEKCYGVVKSGKNDCGSSKHPCAGQATKDADKSEWIYLPKGVCGRLAKGSKESG